MKRKLIALAALAACSGATFAQSNITVYGVVDTGYVKQTGRDAFMGTNQDNKIGFRGSEDLGGGLKATFHLEKRFDLNDGTIGNSSIPSGRGRNSNSGNDWDGAANLGLAGNWGQIRFGRVNELKTETIRKFDPFYQYGVGAMILSSQRSARISNTARYDSPKWSGFGFGATYTLGKGTGTHDEEWTGNVKGKDNDGYAINLNYDNAGFLATANWSRLHDSDSSSVWNIGLGYKFGTARVTLIYEDTNNEGYKGSGSSGFPGGLQYSGVPTGTQTDENVWLLGLEWDVGPGQLDASVQYAKLDTKGVRLNGGKAVDDNLMKYAIGYTYNLSKRTSVYGQLSYTDFDSGEMGWFYTGMSRESVAGIQVGMTHKF